jgi:membrane fusion protein (multidrug efflux system)
MSNAAVAPSAPAKPATKAKRNQQLVILAVVVVVALVIWALYTLIFASHFVSTDNAYVGAETAQVTPLIGGPVAKVLVSETQVVKAGDVLVVLDDSDAKLAVAQAQAELYQAERKVRGYFASDAALAGQVQARAADITSADARVATAKADLEKARVDLSRRQALASSGAVSGEELTSAQNAFSGAQQALASAQAARIQAEASRTAAQGNRQVNDALISGGGVDQNPEVAVARAKLNIAELALSRTVLRAPVGGIVSKKSVEVGQQVSVGAPLMAIVPVTSAYVDANFKEVQLRKVEIGQKVDLEADLYGGKVTYHGVVKGLSGGTGSAFSLIPAQNASGNWIKVVQRLPVRITLDPQELQAHPLRVGLSMKVKIDTASGSH